MDHAELLSDDDDDIIAACEEWETSQPSGNGTKVSKPFTNPS